MSASTAEILNKEEQFDYTKWQQEYFDRMTPEEIDKAASQYAQAHPFKGEAKKIL
jgi:hypothetical protein